MAQTAVTGFAEPFSDTRPFYRGTYFRVVGRTATGSGGGTSGVASGSAQIRLGQLTDFSFPFRNGGRFYLGVRAVLTVTATASGSGTASSSANIVRFRTATGDGVGSATAVGILVAVRTATGSGVGTMDSTGLRIVLRTATGSGDGSGSAFFGQIPSRTATGSGVGSGTAVDLVINIRTATGSGAGSGTGVWLLVSLRTATGSGAGTQTGVGARIERRTATGSGAGTGTADWDKSHIFRVPYIDTYGGGKFGMFDVENRLGSYYKNYTRGLNLYKLTNGEYTTVEQRDQGQVKKLWHGGRDHFLTDVEYAELLADGFGANIT
jgi:hypothetical protein